MSEEYNRPQFQDEDEGMEIDWMAILTNLLKKWKFIMIVTCIFGILGIVSALTMHRKWGVTMTLAPEIQRSGSSSLSSLSSMLGLGNVSMGPTTDAMSITLFPQICSSTPFLTSLFPVELTPYQSPEDIRDGAAPPKPVTVFEHISGDDKPKKGLAKWMENRRKKDEVEVDQSIINPSMLTRKQAAVAKALSERISASVDNKTGVTTVNVVLDDRLMVTQLADTVVHRLQTYVSDYRTRKAIDDYNYYVKMADEAHEELVKAQAAYAARVDYDRSVILQSVNSERERLQQEVTLANQIYGQQVQQREMAKAKIQEDKPMYAVIQPASMPQSPMNSRKKRVLIWGFMGFFLSCAWAGIGEDLWKKFRGGVKEAMEEEKEA